MLNDIIPVIETKRRCLLLFAILAVAILLFTQAAAAPGPCDGAKALLDAKLYEDAQKAYIGLLNTSFDCAQKGLLSIRQEQAKDFLKNGSVYENAGHMVKAKEAYVEALKIDPNLEDAQVALERINKDRLNVLMDFSAFLDIFSKIQFDSILIIVLDIILALIFLLYFLPSQIIPWLINQINRFSPNLSIWLRGVYYWLYGRPQLDISNFDKGITEFEIGKALEPIVEEGINNFDGKKTRPRFYLVEGSDKPLNIPAGIKTTPQLKLISELIEWSFPQNVITLSGFLQKQTRLGAGLTLVLTDNRTGKIIKNDTIWQYDFDLDFTTSDEKEINPYYRLAELASIWAIYQMENFIRPDKKFTALGTADWKSYAYYQSGVHWMNEDNRKKARHQFARALNKDLRNYGALFNMGILDIDDGNYEKACVRLDMARELSEKNYKCKQDIINKEQPGLDFSRNPIWYKAMYQLAATYVYKRNSENEKENFEKAEETVRILVETVYSGIRYLKKYDEFRVFLISNIAYINSLYATILLEIGKETEAASIFDKCKDYQNKLDPGIFKSGIDFVHSTNTPNYYFVCYNLACYYSICGKKAINNEKIEAYYKSIEQLEYAIEIEGSIIKLAKKYPSLRDIREDEIYLFNWNEIPGKGEQILKNLLRIYFDIDWVMNANVEKINDNKNIKVSYDKQSILLEFKGNDNINVKFNEIETNEFGKAKFTFAKLIDKYSKKKTPGSTDTPNPSDLSDISIIGKTFALKLKENGIITHCDLIGRTNTPSARENLEKELGVDKNLLLQWALLADMTRIAGITPYLNLLDEADIDSLEDLKKSNPCELVVLLKQLNEAHSIVKQPLSDKVVQHWVEEADKIEPIVKVS